YLFGSLVFLVFSIRCTFLFDNYFLIPLIALVAINFYIITTYNNGFVFSIIIKIEIEVHIVQAVQSFFKLKQVFISTGISFKFVFKHMRRIFHLFIHIFHLLFKFFHVDFFIL